MTNNQNGFGIIGVLLVIVVLAAVGGAGYMVYSSQSKKAASSNSTSVDSSKKSDDKKVNYAVNGVLKIPELGIKLNMGDGAKDATYALASDGSVGISTKSLEAFASSCQASKKNVAMISTFKDKDGEDFFASGTNIENFPDAVLINGTYYALNFSPITQSPCDDAQLSKPNDKFTETALKAQEGFSNTTIEKLGSN